jgi:hypothetical protein
VRFRFLAADAVSFAPNRRFHIVNSNHLRRGFEKPDQDENVPFGYPTILPWDPDRPQMQLSGGFPTLDAKSVLRWSLYAELGVARGSVQSAPAPALS